MSTIEFLYEITTELRIIFSNSSSSSCSSCYEKKKSFLKENSNSCLFVDNKAEIYRNEKNIVDLYVIFIRYSSMVSETIPFHRDYQSLYSKDRTSFRKKLMSVLDELEGLKPLVQRQIQRAQGTAQTYELDGQERRQYGLTSSSIEQHVADNGASLNKSDWKVQRGCSTSLQRSKLLATIRCHHQISQTNSSKSYLSVYLFQSRKLCLDTPFLDQMVFMVNYPTNMDLSLVEISSLNQVGQNDITGSSNDDSKLDKSAMASVLSLDDGSWSSQADNLSIPFCDVNDNFPLVRQPSPPPVLAQVQPEYVPIPPSKVADPRPGPVNSLTDGTPSSGTYQNLHIVSCTLVHTLSPDQRKEIYHHLNNGEKPVKMLDEFLRLAKENTARNLETCGVLAGLLRNRVFHLTTLIIPKQESTSDSVCYQKPLQLLWLQQTHQVLTVSFICLILVVFLLYGTVNNGVSILTRSPRMEAVFMSTAPMSI